MCLLVDAAADSLGLVFCSRFCKVSKLYMVSPLGQHQQQTGSLFCCVQQHTSCRVLCASVQRSVSSALPLLPSRAYKTLERIDRHKSLLVSAIQQAVAYWASSSLTESSMLPVCVGE